MTTLAALFSTRTVRYCSRIPVADCTRVITLTNLHLTVEFPRYVRFAIEQLEEACRHNSKRGILKCLTVLLPVATETRFLGAAKS